MRNKRLLAVTAAAVMLTLSACNYDKPSGDGESTTTASSEQEQTTEPVEEVGENRETARLANVILGSVEFPQTVEITDEAQISDGIGLDLDKIDEYCVLQQMMSVHLVEVIVVKPAPGEMDNVINELNERKKDLLDTYAFYPNQVASAENTVVGRKGDYAYLICHEESEKAEEALRAEISE